MPTCRAPNEIILHSICSWKREEKKKVHTVDIKQQQATNSIDVTIKDLCVCFVGYSRMATYGVFRIEPFRETYKIEIEIA